MPGAPAGPRDRSGDLLALWRLSERREPLVVKIATWAALGIIEGTLKPGSELNSVDLSERFETSRTPVREALMLLEQEGLVEIHPRRRPRVTRFTLKQVRDIYEVRETLLSIVGRLVSSRASDADIADMRARVTEMRRHADGGDVDGYFWCHVALQSRMTEITGNSTLQWVLDSLAMRTLILRHASLEQAGRLSASVAAQELIFAAIEDRDAELAAMLLVRATRAALGAIEQGEWDPGAEESTPRRRSPTRPAVHAVDNFTRRSP